MGDLRQDKSQDISKVVFLIRSFHLELHSFFSIKSNKDKKKSFMVYLAVEQNQSSPLKDEHIENEMHVLFSFSNNPDKN